VPRPLLVCARSLPALLLAAILVAFASPARAAIAGETPALLGVPIEFVLFALTLLGVAAFHHRTLEVALTGLAAITLYKLGFTGFKAGPGIGGLGEHLLHEWVLLANLLALLLGFALLSNHFEKSRVPAVLPHFLPDDWKGAFVLLVIVLVFSGFLDNIAAAIIGATVAGVVFRHRESKGLTGMAGSDEVLTEVLAPRPI
jgi:hypothetical protein